MNATPERSIVKKISCHSGWCNSVLNTQKNPDIQQELLL